MTANQIAFYQAQEARRANLAKEGIEGAKLGESHRANLVQESIGRGQLAETRRHNTTAEGIDFYKASNLANLQQAQADKASSEVGALSARNAETQRSNMAKEALDRARLEEQHRHSVVEEGREIFDSGVKAGGTILQNFMGLIRVIGGNP